MKMHYLLFFLALVLGIIAVVCTYLFGILPRHEHYQTLLAEEQQLRDRIGELEEKFSRTRPSAVVAEWRDKVQPWAQAVSSRLSYFDTLADDERLDVVVPEEEKELPKFWYQRERERRMKALSDETFNAQLVMNSSIMSGHEPPAPKGAGWNPDAAEVEEWLENYERAASFVREMIEANAREINTLAIWPSEVIMPAPEGTVHLERVGYEIVISMEDFASYLGRLHASDTYASISGMSLMKAGPLSEPDAPVRAAFVLERTRFVPAEARKEREAAPTIRRRTLGGDSDIAPAAIAGGIKIQYSEEEMARIRAANADQNPGFFRSILRWFGI